MSSTARFTIKGQPNETLFSLIEQENELCLVGGNRKQENKPPSVENYHKFPLTFKDRTLSLQGGNPFEESDDIVTERLLGLAESLIESNFQGFESVYEEETPSDDSKKPGYNPDEIFVENKPFSLQQIVDLIESKDIDIAPDFQRYFIWDKTRQSRLIESVLLGLPLPSIYLSQYKDGMLTVVDGLQRLNTIKDFFDDKFTLSNLEYLTECNGKKYSNLNEVLKPLRLRRLGQTQVMCFVIDYRSPTQLKFDLFRRLNTGGKPLNNQEIRNCLSKPKLQKLLHDMTTSAEFKEATSGSVKATRMEDKEAALRFMYFYDQYSESNPIGDYDGYMDISLDKYVDLKNNDLDSSKYLDLYTRSLDLAAHLFDEHAFRKVGTNFETQKRNQINKLLMLCITVLLAQFDKVATSKIIQDFPGDDFIKNLAKLIESNEEFFRAITWSTNSKWNIKIAMETLRNELFAELFEHYS